MPPPVDPALVKQERELLQQVKARSFAVTPKAIKIFGSVKASWNVELPDSPLFDIEVRLNESTVAPKGEKTFTLQQSTGFVLSVKTEHASRQLRRQTVTVDTSECKQELLEGFGITTFIRVEANKRFTGQDKFSLRGDGTKVTLQQGTILIQLPLTVTVPNWFDANTDVMIQLGATGFGKVKFRTTFIGVDVSWNFFEHLASLGCTAIVQNAMEQMAHAFLANISDAELCPVMANGFTVEVNKKLAALSEKDPGKRKFLLTSLTLTPDGAVITACPKGNVTNDLPPLDHAPGSSRIVKRKQRA